eukprot:13065101-Alexandrium_andersonii.AAC.1
MHRDVFRVGLCDGVGAGLLVLQNTVGEVKWNVRVESCPVRAAIIRARAPGSLIIPTLEEATPQAKVIA